MAKRKDRPLTEEERRVNRERAAKRRAARAAQSRKQHLAKVAARKQPARKEAEVLLLQYKASLASSGSADE